MLNQIPAEFWMVIISVLTLFLVFIMYQIANLLKESTKTMAETTKVVTELQDTVKKANLVLEDAAEVVSMTKTTVEEVQDNVVTPVIKIASIIGMVSDIVDSFTGGFKGTKE
ncbi:MAG: DUF948 domain-containing protein [Candidatus Dojkabacteria bacterium]|nr:MAG: DUF948 domain-containing protein [Candidatus Dojkabacteria bacterium]